MKPYEITFLALPDITEEELKSLQEKIRNLIQEEGGILADFKNPKRINLKSPISTRSLPKIHSASLLSLTFSLSPQKIESLKKQINSENQIVRFLIVSPKTIGKTPKKISARPLRKTKKNDLAHPLDGRESKPFPKREVEKRKKAGLKDIEKELDKILE